MAEICNGNSGFSSSVDRMQISLEAIESGTTGGVNPIPRQLNSVGTPELGLDSASTSNKKVDGGSVSPTDSSSGATGAPPSNRPDSSMTDSVSDAGSDSLGDHSPVSLPTFRDPGTCQWTSTYAANAPSEDRSASLVNVLLRPQNEGHSLVRLNLWAVIDGHGGGSVATYASEVLLPHIAANISHVLECEIVDCGECKVNGELRDANAHDLDGLIRNCDEGHINPNSINYTSPDEPEEQEDALSVESGLSFENEDVFEPIEPEANESDSSVELATSHDSVKGDTALSVSSDRTTPPATRDSPTGTHSPDEIARITDAVTDSFLDVDEGWINSIDGSFVCHTNGQLNAGACALVVFTVQRLEWTNRLCKDQDVVESDTVGDKDDLSSIPITTTASDDMTESALESKITETEEEDDDSEGSEASKVLQGKGSSLQNTYSGCQCHSYQSREAMLYTAHVGDCRAVLLGSEAQYPTQVRPVENSLNEHIDENDDDTSCSSIDDEEYLSSSDDSSDEDEDLYGSVLPSSYRSYMSRSRRPSFRLSLGSEHDKPFVALPPLNVEVSCSSEESDMQRAQKVARQSRNFGASKGVLKSLDDYQVLPTPLYFPPGMRQIELTTDHSAYNKAEQTAVLNRCNHAPSAISTGVGGKILRVAGSLAVTRALGDAYLKTPLLSMFPYQRHAPYITARPEVTCRLLPRGGDTNETALLILATDGVWERASGLDILRWVRNYYEERAADEGTPRRRHSENGDRFSQENEHAVVEDEQEGALGSPRNHSDSSRVSRKRKVRARLARRSGASKRRLSSQSTAADVIVRRVLNKVRRLRNMSMQDLMSLPKGRARRSKHDDITTSVIDLAAFVN